MRFSLVLFVPFAILVGMVGAQPPPVSPPVPQFELVAEGTVRIEQAGVFNVPLGQRVSALVTEGELFLPNGTRIGAVVPGTGIGNGLVANDGIFYASVIMTVKVDGEDNSFVYMHTQGVGEELVNSMVWVYMETTSTNFKALNSRFLIANMTFSEPPSLGVYGLVDQISL
ncbi:hypothetical protein OBBRIDRAFT_791357 [Obba rivulosa]|uniref:Uncharacterized protein n=1 Tax=Obba rivulosa TaxID=1052685 RepID=A0A8E2DLB4_9APHY|nr:hypothetical protein OBBRIDRAFT_791357 [Obba rivulosa]